MIVFPELYQANALNLPIADNTVDCVVTSPPYWGLRDYHVDNQLGMESTPEEYCNNMTNVFREIWRVLKPTGTVWLNLGDSYAGSGRGPSKWNPSQEMQSDQTPPSGLKPKDLVGIPWRVAFALQADGWYLRSDIIWSKPNPMPESVQDRPTKAHEYIFLLTKSKNYYYDADAIGEPAKDWGIRDRTNGKYHNEGTGLQPHTGLEKSYATKNKRSVWTVTTKPYADAHFATFPEDLIEPCILAGSPEGGIVLDPFVGSGTAMVVAQKHRRKGIGIDLNKEYLDLAVKRIKNSKYNNQFDLF